MRRLVSLRTIETAWSYEEMLRIGLDMACHKIHLNLAFTTIKRKGQKLTPKFNEINKEVNKLKENFIDDVNFLD